MVESSSDPTESSLDTDPDSSLGERREGEGFEEEDRVRDCVSGVETSSRSRPFTGVRRGNTGARTVMVCERRARMLFPIFGHRSEDLDVGVERNGSTLICSSSSYFLPTSNIHAPEKGVGEECRAHDPFARSVRLGSVHSRAGRLSFEGTAVQE